MLNGLNLSRFTFLLKGLPRMVLSARRWRTRHGGRPQLTGSSQSMVGAPLPSASVCCMCVRVRVRVCACVCVCVRCRRLLHEFMHVD
jgi:hypothetical protein